MTKRLFMFLYGVFAYVTFLGTFLYAMAFVSGMPVPVTLDGLPSGPLWPALAVDAGLLTLFAVQHSVMARRWFKAWWTQIVPHAIERSTYVLCASVALLLLFWQWRPLGGVVWSVEAQAAKVALWALAGAGWGLVLVTTFLINHFELFGLQQVWLALTRRDQPKAAFSTPGPYRMVRHPLYVGFIIAFWSTPVMTLAHLVFALATTAYIVLAIQFEEQDLVVEHGEAYERYRQNVPMLVPGVRAR